MPKKRVPRDRNPEVEKKIRESESFKPKVPENLQAELKEPERPPGHFDPNEMLSEEETQECYERVEKILEEENDKELNLEKSDVTVPGQEWVLVSFVGEECRQKTEKLGMKIWGCFDSVQNAKKHAERLNKFVENKIFDIYILEMYTWARIPPNKECIADQNYHEDQLHELITEHKRHQLRAKEVFDTRKKKLMNNPDINKFKDELKEYTNEAALREVMGEPEKMPTFDLENTTGPEAGIIKKSDEKPSEKTD